MRDNNKRQARQSSVSAGNDRRAPLLARARQARGSASADSARRRAGPPRNRWDSSFVSDEMPLVLLRSGVGSVEKKYVVLLGQRKVLEHCPASLLVPWPPESCPSRPSCHHSHELPKHKWTSRVPAQKLSSARGPQREDRTPREAACSALHALLCALHAPRQAPSPQHSSYAVTSLHKVGPRAGNTCCPVPRPPCHVGPARGLFGHGYAAS